MINDGGPAFPEAGLSGLPNDQFVYGRSGMTLRDYFAAKALGSFLCRSSYDNETFTQAATDAYRYADAMIKQRGEE